MAAKVLKILKGLIAAYIITGILLLIFTFIIYKTQLSDTLMTVFVIAIYVISNIVGGAVISKHVDSRKFLWGALAGVMYFVVLLIVSMIVTKSFFENAGNVIVAFAFCTIGGMLGGMIRK